MAIKTPLMRHIARCEIEKLFPGMSTAALEEYATSVVRQWITNNLRAGVFSVAVNYWLHLVEQDWQVRAGLEVCPSATGHWTELQRERRMRMADRLKTAIYARVSTDQQKVDPQLRDLRELIASRGWDAAKEYVDVGISGSKDSRPAWNELWDAIQKDRVRVLVVHALDRLGGRSRIS